MELWNVAKFAMGDMWVPMASASCCYSGFKVQQISERAAGVGKAETAITTFPNSVP